MSKPLPQSSLATLIALTLMGSAPSLRAGSFSTDFSSGLPAGATLFGDTGEGNAGVVEAGVLKLTKLVGSQQAAMIIDDLDGGKVVHGFTANFKLRIGGGSGADGFSFNFAGDIPDGGIGEEGAGSGFSLCFDTYDNGGGEAPAIDVRKGGNLIASVKGVGLVFRKDAFVNVQVKVDNDGTLDVSVDNTVIHSNLIGAFVPTAGRFAFGARTGGSFDNHWVDDVSITTVTTGPSGPTVVAAAPQGLGVLATSVLSATLQDSTTKVAPGTVQLKFNGAVVTPKIATTGSETTVTFDPPGLLPSGSTNQVELRFKDTANPPVEQVFAWTFVTESYRSLEAARAVPASQVDTSKPGFTVRTVKARLDSVFVTSSAPYEALLAGIAIDGATGKPYENTADLSAAGPDGLFIEEETINYEDLGGTAGNFQDDRRTPGIPGTDGWVDRYALEILTYLDLPAGLVTLGVNSDDGFKLLSGTPDPRSALSTLLGNFEGGRGASDTLCSFVVEQAGLYPIRLFYYDGTGNGSVEFFSVLADGSKVLINDPNTAGSIKAYRARAAGAPGLPPFILTASPGQGEVDVSIKPKIDVLVRDTALALDPGSVQVALNGTPATATVTKTGTDTLVSFRAPASLPGKAPATVRITYKTTGANPQTVSQEWQFTTAEAAAVSAGLSSVKINFQNSTSAGFPGYLPDNGVPFADRGNGYSYGWNKDNSGNARNRDQTDKALAPDERYDTFNHMQKPGGPWVWEIAVPNGTYSVRIVGGEPNNFDQTIRIKAEDVLVVNGAPCTTTERFREGTALVNVEDGRLTVTASDADGAVNCKIAFMEIRSVLRVNFQNSTSAGFPGYLPDNGVPFADRGNGYSYGWNKDNSGNARNRDQTDKALAPDERYDTFNHMQKPGGPWVWEIAVPNGTYSVRIVGGEPNNFDQTIRIKAEDVLVVNGDPCTTTERFREGTKPVKVEDGRLTVTASDADGAVNCKIAFLEMTAEEISTDAPAKPVAITATRSGDSLVISWPADATGFTLESASSLGGAWTAVSGVSGNSATLPVSAAQQFFRLRK